MSKAAGLTRVHVFLTKEQCRWIELRANGVRSKGSVIREVLNRVMEMMPMEDAPAPE